MSQRSFSPFSLVLAAVPLMLVVSLLTFAGPCGVHEDGSVSSCFWAHRSMLGVACVALALGIVRLFATQEAMVRGLDIATAALGILIAITPGILINLCMMETMRCHTIMRPSTLIFSIVLVACSVVHFITLGSRERKEAVL